MIKTFVFLACVLVLSACSTNNSWEKECADLRRQSAELEHRHCQLNASIDSLWDTTSTRLAQAFPPGFPATDRAIFLKARNADHIRMFMSFKQLDAGTQALVSEAGQYDAILAAQMRALLEQTQAFESKKIQFLRKVEAQDTAIIRIYADALRIPENTICK